MKRIALVVMALLILLFPASASADFGEAGGGIRYIYVYGDSYLNGEEIWDGYLQYHGIERTQFWTAAQGGARAFYLDGVPNTNDDANCDSVNGYDPSWCPGFIIRQVLYENGACRVDYDDAGGVHDGKSGPTCIADRDIGPNDICLFGTGTNDVNTGQPAGWANTIRPQAESATLAILDEFDRVGCPTVVTSSVPLIRGSPSGGNDTSNFWRTDGVLDRDDNAVLFGEWLKNEVETNRPNMLYSDVREAFNDYADRYGEQAFLSLYNCRGGRGSQRRLCGTDPGDCTAPDVCADGVHAVATINGQGTSGRILQAQIIGRDILRLRDIIRDSPVWIGN